MSRVLSGAVTSCQLNFVHKTYSAKFIRVPLPVLRAFS